MRTIRLLILIGFVVIAVAAAPPRTTHKERAEALRPWVERYDAEAHKIQDRKDRLSALRAAAVYHAYYGRPDRASAIAASLPAEDRPRVLASIATGLAESDFDAALKAAAAIDQPEARASACAGIAYIARRDGRLDDALRALDAAPPVFARDLAYIAVVEWHSDRGRFDDARAALLKILDPEVRARAAQRLRVEELLQAGPDDLAARARAAGLDFDKIGHDLADVVRKKAAARDLAAAMKVAPQITDPNPRTLAFLHIAEAQAAAGDAAASRKAFDAAHESAAQIRDENYRGMLRNAVFSAESQYGDADRALRFEREQNEAAAKANAQNPDLPVKMPIMWNYLLRAQIRNQDFPAAIRTAEQSERLFLLDAVARALAERGRTSDIEAWLSRTPDPSARTRILSGIIDGLLLRLGASKAPATQPAVR